VTVDGHLRVTGVSLTKLAALAPLPPALAAPQGMARLSMRYRAGMIDE